MCVRFLREYIDGKDGDSSYDPDNTFPLYLQLESYTNLKYLSAHSEIILISVDDHGCLLVNPRVPVQVSLSEINFLFLHFPFAPYDWKAYFRNVILSHPFPTHIYFYLQALYGIFC